MPFAVGIQNAKFEVNIGTLMRSAYNFNASMVFTIGRRYKHQGSDTTGTPRHIPVLHFSDWRDFQDHAPLGWIPVAVEICDGAHELPTFVHPKSAVYLLGPEDGSLRSDTLAFCKYKVCIPSKHCLNVAVAASIIMYDRRAKGVA